MRLLKKILSLLVTMLWCAIILITISLAMQIINEDPVPMILNYGFTVVTSDKSQEIQSGTLLIIEATGDYQPGDIILCGEDTDHLVLFRVTSVDGDCCFAAEISNSGGSDSEIQNDEIIGEIIYQAPSIKEICNYLHIPLP